jgi:putative two-component system response regulator
VGVKYLTHFEQERQVKQILIDLAKSIRERDIVTYEHSRRVALYAQCVARYLGWNKREARDLALAALVHDLGKTWISNTILNKAAALSLEERLVMQRHPEIGARILIGYEVHPFYVEAVLHHHESWDGQGYPSQLKGAEIPLSARILTVADVYDVLTSQRPYKAPLTTTEARARLLESSGTNFDPMVLRAFVHLIDTKSNFTLTQPVYQLPTLVRKAPLT